MRQGIKWVHISEIVLYKISHCQGFEVVGCDVYMYVFEHHSFNKFCIVKILELLCKYLELSLFNQVSKSS
jgi:hypothetical protein